MEINKEKIEKAIIEQASRDIINDDDLYDRVKRDIDRRVDALFASRVEDRISAAVDECITSGFEREYTKRDGFGKQVGEKTSISKELEAVISNYWTEKVDRSGKARSGSYGTVSRAEWMMARICADEFSSEMKQHIVNVSGALKDQFRSVLDVQVDELLSSVFHVSTKKDKERGNKGRAIISPDAKPVGSK